MTRDEFNAFGIKRYGTKRFVMAMHRETGIPYHTLIRYSTGESIVKRLIEDKLLSLPAKRRKAMKSNRNKKGSV